MTERFAIGGTPIQPELQHRVYGGHSNCVAGWICDPRRPDEKFSVRIVLEKRDAPPEDLGIYIADKTNRGFTTADGQTVPCGFVCRVPLQGDAVEIRVFEVTTNTELMGSPIHLGITPYFEGWLEKVADGIVQGWAWANRPNYRCEIDIHIEGRYLATAFCIHPREGLYPGVGSGADGFQHRIPHRYMDGGEHEIACFFHGTQRHLNGSPRLVRLSAFEFDIISVHSALGDDGILRGAISTSATDRAQIALDLLVDHRPLSRFVARACPPESGNGGNQGRCFGFSVPVSGVEGPVEIALADQAASYPVQVLSDDAVLATQLSCRHVDLREERLVSERSEAQSPRARKSKLLLAIWGENYIEYFCELCLPSLLSGNNLPKYAEQHELEFVVLARTTDFELFGRFPAFDRLRRLIKVEFIAIDDILTSFFDPRPQDIYALALTHAYFRGIKSCGDEATSTNFIFWNADFLAADGTFATLAEVVARGAQCTLAVSLRADLSAKAPLAEHLAEDGTQLEIGPRELVRIALAHPHPTVEAQTLNGYPERTMENIKQVFWRAGAETLIGRFFVWFMLHIRPDAYGTTSTAFATMPSFRSSYLLPTSFMKEVPSVSALSSCRTGKKKASGSGLPTTTLPRSPLRLITGQQASISPPRATSSYLQATRTPRSSPRSKKAWQDSIGLWKKFMRG